MFFIRKAIGTVIIPIWHRSLLTINRIKKLRNFIIYNSISSKLPIYSITKIFEDESTRNFRWWQQRSFSGGIAEYLIRIVVYPMNYLWGVQPAVY
jgi:hypothetical protein